MNESIVDIDQFQLDKELLKQPTLVEKYGFLVNRQKAKLAEAKASLDYCESEIESKIRRNPSKYKLKEPVRESAIKGKVITDKDYQEALKRIRTIQRKLDDYQVIMNALEHRKKSLESLVYLWGASYFSNPSIKGETKEFTDKQKKKRVSKKLKTYQPKED